MRNPNVLTELMDSYQDFNVGELQRNFYQDKNVELVSRPVARYSYALMRAALNVFVQHNFADHLNSLAFDRDSFCTDVQVYVPQVWSFYLEEAQETLPSVKILQLQDLAFIDWGPTGQNEFGAWHRLVFPDFQIDILLQITNQKARLGAFDGLCFLHNDQNKSYILPADQAETCVHLGSVHLQAVIDEILAALGIPPESAISAIKWQMR